MALDAYFHFMKNDAHNDIMHLVPTGTDKMNTEQISPTPSKCTEQISSYSFKYTEQAPPPPL